MLNVEQPQPALLAERQGDEAAELHELRLAEMTVQPIPQRVVVGQVPRDRLGVGKSRLLTAVEPVRALEVHQLVVLSLSESLLSGLHGSLVAAVFAFHRPRDVHPAQFLDPVIAHTLPEDFAPRTSEAPKAGWDVRPDG